MAPYHFLILSILICILGTPSILANPFDGGIGLYYLVNYHFSSPNNRTHHHNRTTSPHVPHHLIEGSIDVVSFNVSNGDQTLNYEENIQISDFYAEQVIATSRNPRIAKVINASFFIHNHNFTKGIPSDPYSLLTTDGTAEVALSVQIRGHSIGKTVIDVVILGYPTTKAQNTTNGKSKQYAWTNQESRILASFDVTVFRRMVYKKLGTAFTIFVAVTTVFTTFLIGTKLDWRIVLKEIKKPKSLLIGVGLEFFIMPLIAFAWAMLILRGNYGWQLVYLAIGACPGGGHSPFWTMMLDGNLDLAVAMSFVASISALGILPFWLFTLGRIFYAGRFAIPFLTIMASLFGLICPIFFGLLLKHFLPIQADRIGKIVKHVTVVSFIIVGVFGCAVNSYVFALLDWHHLVCGFLLPWCGYALTYPLARWVFRRNHRDSIAIAIENGCLNVAVPTVLIQLTLAPPESDLSLVVPVGVVIFASWPLWIYFIVLVIKKRLAMPTRPLQVLHVSNVEIGLQRQNEPKDDEVIEIRVKGEKCV